MPATVIGNTQLTLLDWAKRKDPDGKIARVINLLGQSNEILEDMLWEQGNLPTGNRTTVVTGLPGVTRRILNRGVAPTKPTTDQLDDAAEILEAWCVVDQKIADLNGASAEFLLAQAKMYLEAMNQTFVQDLFYADTTVNSERMMGFTPRYASLTGVNGQNILNAGGTGSNNTSVWLVGWGENAVTGIFPKGSTAGLIHENYGVETVQDTAQDTNGISGSVLRAYRSRFEWTCGLAVKDWRYGVRLANIDIPDLIGNTGTQGAQQLIKLMSRMQDRVPNTMAVRLAYYCNRTVASILKVQALDKSQNAISIVDAISQFGGVKGKQMEFLGIPVRRCDQLLATESLVS